MGFLLQSSRLTEAGFPHGFTLRHGEDGRVLDFAFPSPNAGDSVSAVALALGAAPSRVYQVTQVHGADVIEVVSTSGTSAADVVNTRADAIVLRASTGAPRSAVGIRVADCIPLLVADPVTGDVAAIHAGWRGVVQRVAKAALDRLAPGRKLAAIGPCIGPCCFEVSREVAEEIAAATDARVVHSDEVPGKAHVDLRTAMRFQLQALGFASEDVEDVGGCSKCDAALYHSYRRDGAESGRMLGVIASR
ncbi:MAG: polyphenol oxidase family protein [Polyangiaceae bacterium]